MKSSQLAGRIILWLVAAVFLLFSSCSIDDNIQFVDASRQETSFSLPSRQQRPERVPWWLPSYKSIRVQNPNGILGFANDDTDPASGYDSLNDMLLKLRGGSDKRSSGAADKEKDKRRSGSKPKGKKHKPKSKNKNKRKQQQTDDGEDDADGTKELPDDPSQDSTEEASAATTSDEEEAAVPSKLFLMDPFRMNEMARYEASLAEDPTQQEDSNDEETTSEETEEEETDIESKRKKPRDARKPKKRDATTTTTKDSTSLVVDDKVAESRNGKQKKREPKVKGGKRKPVKTTDSSEAEKDVDGLEEDTSTALATNDFSYEPESQDDEATEQSSSFWWIDVWTQQLSDPEDIEEEAEIENGAMDVDAANPNGTVVDANDIKASENDETRRVAKESEKRASKANTQVLPTNSDVDDAVSSDSDALSDGEGSVDPIQKRIAAIEKAREGVERAQAEERAKTRKRNFWGFRPRDDILVDLYLDSNETTVATADEADADTNTTTTVSGNETTALVIDPNATSATSESSELPIPKSYVSSGAWVLVDNLITIGLASKFQSVRLSRKLRRIRKLSARITRLHGVLSGKPRQSQSLGPEILNKTTADATLMEGTSLEEQNETGEPRIPQRSPEEIEEEFQRMERVIEIDRLIGEGQQRLEALICEKDVLQRRPNPLFNYTTTETIVNVDEETKEDRATKNKNNKKGVEPAAASEAETTTTTKVKIEATRNMNFPPDDLVAEYLDMMISTRRLVKMNHTDLWKESGDDGDEEEESIGDDLFTASANAHRLYQGSPSVGKNGNGTNKNGKKNGGGGSWLLRQSVGGRRSLGEKIGQAAETAAYKAVTASLMSFLARLISGLHGINVMKHSDIRLVLEQSPDLPPIPKDGIIRGNHKSYAEETIKTVMRRKSRRSKKRSSKASFVQQEAVTETLLSHVQISAPLFKLFPLAWQRALLGNIIALSCALISDFLDGLHFQILGHQLSFAFRPITEVDMARHFQMAGGRFNQRRYKAAEFEAAVQATAEDLKEELKFLDSWHERALGSGVLRAQIANMIARIVLTLTDEVLSGARMDLWSVQAGGPRMLAGLEHRIDEDDDDEEEDDE